MTTKNKTKSTESYNSASPYDSKQLPDATYDYETENGEYAFEVQRQGRGEHKTFRTGRTNRLSYGERLDPEDKQDFWKDGRGDHPALLYLLPALAKADRSIPVWIPEGERDAKMLADLGEIATTNPHGALSWLPEQGERLADRDVIICVDNDDAGRKRLAIIRATLGKAASVSVVRFEDMPPGSDVGDFLDAGNTLEALKARIVPLKPLVVLKADTLHENVNHIEAALIAAGTEIYWRAGGFVRPVTTAKGSILVAVSPHDLRDHMSKVCDFARYNKEGELVPTGPTLDLANTLLSRVGRWKLSEINGIHTAPLVSPKGDVLAKPGFDPASGLYLVLPKGEIRIGDTRQEAKDALAALRDLLSDFPAVDDVDRSVMLTALLTPLVRAMIDVAPLMAIRAHTPGTGKSYLVDCCTMLAQGQKSDGLTLTQSEEENRKLQAAVAMTGVSVISMDNVNGALKGDFLCQLVERPSVQPRILGKSEAPKIRNVFTIYVNGNNLYIEGDLTRRTLLCNLDSGLERPETRKFKKDPVKLIAENRERFLGYALTIILAYIRSGERVKVAPFNSFGQWSQMVREPLVWLGCADPCKSVEAVREDDPERTAIQALFSAWPSASGPLSAGQLIAASQGGSIDDTPLRRALLEVAGDTRDTIGRKKLGNYLSGIKQRPVDGRYLEARMDSHSKTNVYVLREALQMAA